MAREDIGSEIKKTGGSNAMNKYQNPDSKIGRGIHSECTKTSTHTFSSHLMRCDENYQTKETTREKRHERIADDMKSYGPDARSC